MPAPKTGNDFTMRVRIAPEDWETLKEIATHERTTPSEIVRRQLRELFGAFAPRKARKQKAS